MQVNHDYDVNIYRIKSYGKGEIEVVLPLKDIPAPSTENEEFGEQHKVLPIETITNSAIVMPDKLIKDWPLESVADLNKEHVQQLLDLKPEVVIIGTGEKLIWPNRALLAPLINANIGYEIMDSAAACRTYNILSHEGRDVAAALMMI